MYGFTALHNPNTSALLATFHLQNFLCFGLLGICGPVTDPTPDLVRASLTVSSSVIQRTTLGYSPFSVKQPSPSSKAASHRSSSRGVNSSDMVALKLYEGLD